MRSTIKFSLLFSLVGLIPVFAQSKLPNTPVREVTEEYFGVKVTDPYRWLENTKDAEVIAWMKAQNDYTRSVLAALPGRDQSHQGPGQRRLCRLRVTGLGRSLFLLQGRARLRQP
jgi:prolyl oligopeptidase